MNVATARVFRRVGSDGNAVPWVPRPAGKKPRSALFDFNILAQDVPAVAFVEGDPFAGQADRVPAVAAQAWRGVRELQGQPPSAASGIGRYQHLTPQRDSAGLRGPTARVGVGKSA